METCGLTAEYNPFHIGHLRQLQMIRDQLGKKGGVVVCMSGPFCQRGVPALLDKGERTKLALTMGADLVLELPFVFSSATAERFAEGAVMTLCATGVVRQIAYGTENPDRHADIRHLASILADEPEGFSAFLQEGIREGLGFAAAREAAMKQFTGDGRISELLSRSNTILAVEYEKALLRHGALPTLALPLVEKDKTSASFIRDRVQDALSSDERTAFWSLLNDLSSSLPPASLASVMRTVAEGEGYVTEEMMAPGWLLSPVFFDRDALMHMEGMQGGLGARIFNYIRHDPGKHIDKQVPRPYDAFIRQMATRSFPASRIRRAILWAAMGIRADDDALLKNGPGYIRVLGFTRQGKRLLSYMRREARLPIVTNASDFHKLEDVSAKRQAALDLRAQAVWNEYAGRRGQSEFERVVIQTR